MIKRGDSVITRKMVFGEINFETFHRFHHVILTFQNQSELMMKVINLIYLEKLAFKLK